ncbi:MAG: hypothetical protein ACE366_00535 [Bradymonadia bacterium]
MHAHHNVPTAARRLSRVLLGVAAAASLTLTACDDDDGAAGTTAGAGGGVAGAGGETGGAGGEAGAGGMMVEQPATATINHSFGRYALESYEEVEDCVAWTLNNEEAIYVNGVHLGNDGGFHHSNWFVVPDTEYEGPDGFFECGDRGFSELIAASKGTVLFAQSTQSIIENQAFAPGVVVKIPPRHKIVAGVHLLNLSDRPVDTELRMGLDLVHPKTVNVILSPFRLTYYDLDIPAQTEARFNGTCNFAEAFEREAGTPFDIKLHWVLPHYHNLGNYFHLELMGGERDGESLFTLEGFNAEANGMSFTPPIHLTDIDGLRFSCGYRNPRDVPVGWGIGDQEMCVMLGLAESPVMLDGTVLSNNVDGMGEDGRMQNSGDCRIIAIPRHPDQTLPTEEEKAGELYVPPTDPSDEDVRPAPTCVDTPADVMASPPATLSSLKTGVFQPSCSFSACHGGPNPAMGLDLSGDDLYASIMNHEVKAPTDMPLVAPGDPEGSYLYHLMSKCEPTAGGATVNHMPLNAPTLMSPALVATVRDWIAMGAEDN